MNKYEILGTIGEGTYGVVLKARRVDTGGIVAIKKFKEGEDDEQVKKTALREVRLLKQLKHENIVSLLEVFRRPVDMKLFLVFEFVEKTILEELDDHPYGLKENDVRLYTFQLLKALHYCHSMRVTHRDVKPENILIDTKTRHLKLCDFGFARNIGGSGGSGLYTDYVATRWYRCPELLVGDMNYNQAVDVWAVGCLIAEVATGVPLFPGESDLDQLLLILRCVGKVTPKQLLAFTKNPQYKGVTLPSVRLTEPLEKKLAGAIRNTNLLSFLKSTLIADPNVRATCAGLLGSAYILEGGQEFVTGVAASAAAQPKAEAHQITQHPQPHPPPGKADAKLMTNPPSPVPAPPVAQQAPQAEDPAAVSKPYTNWGNLFFQQESTTVSQRRGDLPPNAALPPEPPPASTRPYGREGVGGVAAAGGASGAASGNLPSLARVPSREGSASGPMPSRVAKGSADGRPSLSGGFSAIGEKHRQITPLVGFPTAPAHGEEKGTPDKSRQQQQPQQQGFVGMSLRAKAGGSREATPSQAIRQRDMVAEMRGSSREGFAPHSHPSGSLGLATSSGPGPSQQAGMAATSSSSSSSSTAEATSSSSMPKSQSRAPKASHPPPPTHYRDHSSSFMASTLQAGKNVSLMTSFPGMGTQTTLLPDLPSERMYTGFEPPSVLLKQAKPKKKKAAAKKGTFGQSNLFRSTQGPISHSTYMPSYSSGHTMYNKSSMHFLGSGHTGGRTGIVMSTRPAELSPASRVGFGTPFTGPSMKSFVGLGHSGSK